MRKLFILVLIALLLGVGVVALIETDPGYVLIAYGNYTLESSLWVGLLALALFTVVVYLSLRLVRKLFSGQHSLNSWLGNRRSRKAARATNQGLLSLIEGNWHKARRLLLRGVKGSDTPLVNYLAAARASYRLNDIEKMREYLSAAESAENRAGVAVELTQAEMRLHAGEYEHALAALDRSRSNVGRHPYVLDLMSKAYLGLGDWANLAALLPDLKKHKTLAADDLHKLERTVYSNLLESSASGSADSGVAELQSYWQKLPAEMKKDQEVSHSYLALLTRAGGTEAAGKIIVRSLKKSWDPVLVRQYGLLEGSNAGKQLAQAEAWLAAHDSDAELLLCLGRLAARDNLWGKARDYFEASYRLQPSAEICAELGRLLYGMGEETVSAAYFREGLLLSQSSLPELPVPDKTVSRARRLAEQGAG